MQKASRRRRQLSAASARASGASRKAQERKKSVCFSFSLSRHVGILKTLKNEKLSRKLEERDLIMWNRLFTYYQSRASDSERGFGSSERLTYVAGYLWTPTWLSP